MKKIILILTTSILISGSTGIAIAGESKEIAIQSPQKIASNVESDDSVENAKSSLPVKIEGVFDFRAGTNWQGGKLTSDKKKLSAHNSKIVLDTKANIMLTGQAKVDSLTYGAKVVLGTTAASSGSTTYNGSHVFLSGDDFGKIELGTPFNVHSQMQLDAGSIAAGPGGSSWLSYINSNPNGLVGFNVNNEDFFLADFRAKNLSATNQEPSRKINYYTPKIDSFQFGVTWIPDTTNGGSDKPNKVDAYSSQEIKYFDAGGVLKKYNVRYGATNAFALGASYEHQINDDTSYKIALTGEFGKAIQSAAFKGKDANDAYDPNLVKDDGVLYGDGKLSNLKAYHIGAQLTSGKFSYGLSYGNLGKSFTSVNTLKYNKGRNSYFYAAAINYAEGPMNVGLTYRGSNTNKNIANMVAISSDYKISPGLVGYGEISYGSGKGTGGFMNEVTHTIDKKSQKFKGAVFLLGLKVKI